MPVVSKPLFFILLALSSWSLTAEVPINKSLWRSVAIKGYDCVAYHKEGKAIEGKKEFSKEHLGAKWYFSTKANLDLFSKSPEAYMPRYGGYCAWAMSNGYKAKIDPKSFAVVDKKLYLNYNAEIHAKWGKDQSNLISKADQEWKKLIKK